MGEHVTAFETRLDWTGPQNVGLGGPMFSTPLFDDPCITSTRLDLPSYRLIRVLG